ncbi:MAG: hypothetical protein KG003_02570 [Bacteroidetes bacterium]|nr:hypothetical protein [Bacteroidota bacterium]
MRPTFKLLIQGTFTFFYAASSYAQTDSVRNKLADSKAIRVPTGIRISLLSGSNGLDQRFLNNLVIGGNISNKKILNAEKNIRNKNISGGIFSIYAIANIHQTSDTAIRNKHSRFHPAYISISQKNIFGAAYDKALWQLLFRGNDPYLGQQMEIKNTKFQQVTYRNFGIGFSNLLPIKNSNWSTETEIGFSQVLTWRDLRLTNTSVYTDPDRNYVDVKYNLDFQNSGNNGASGVGYGFYTNWKAHTRSKSGSFYFIVNNLGAANISDMMRIQKSMDTVVRVDQTSIDLKTLNSSSWLEYFKDTLNQELAPDTSYTSKWVMLPFELEFKYFSRSFEFDIQYLYIKGYLPKISVQPVKAFVRGGFSISPELQLGGFDTYNLNFYLKHSTKNKGNNKLRTLASIGIYGTEAWLLPSKAHGAGISAMFFYFF